MQLHVAIFTYLEQLLREKACLAPAILEWFVFIALIDIATSEPPVRVRQKGTRGGRFSLVDIGACERNQRFKNAVAAG